MNRATSRRTRDAPLGTDSGSCRVGLGFRIFQNVRKLLYETPNSTGVHAGIGNVLAARVVLLAMVATSLNAHWTTTSLS